MAGWMFVCAKSASAATAALGFAGYVLNALGVTGTAPQVSVALLAVVMLTAVGAVSTGNSFAVPIAVSFAPGGPGLPGLLHATALMFVAYTGYGRIATLGEEVRVPGKNIPRPIVVMSSGGRDILPGRGQRA